MRYIITALGCKVNQYEAQAVESLLRERGLEPAEPGGAADVVIVNTCAVTAEGGRKSRQTIRRLQQKYPDAVTAVCGCWSQLSPEDAAALGADVIHGSGDKHAFVEDIVAALRERDRKTFIDDPFHRRSFEPLPSGAVDGRTRAMLKIQDGCLNFCTYCVIPYTRGRLRSLPLDAITTEAAKLAQEGFRELVLTGIEIASYGVDLPEKPDLADAVLAAHAGGPELRLRLGSLEPTVVTEDFCRRIAACGAVCDHFHLSLQSGCDRTLQRMNRKYDTAFFREVCARLRRAFPGCALTADLITGFPGETEADHAETLAFLREIGFSQVHVFPYSRRPGTKADAMPEQLSHAVKNARAHEAQTVADETRQVYLRAQVGRVLSVQFETERGGVWTGHAENYCMVATTGEALHSVVRNVQITTVDGETLVGIIV
ncbi:MAG: tRNA (N(6)-L-threonylcarbamoyladenosine(37)-C(2))-methylthiotransferase MtaB [Oscillospiraceae bacterium]|nr:tRNA (N(6)-L-threonylcarbamoyladenosine(37)-C(2))-methylthiotransferase MtaB [Oscillospiraceae bacterium]